MRRTRFLLLGVVLLSLFLCAPEPVGPSQQAATRASIAGRVTGADTGQPQRDATVVLSSSILQRPLTTTTDDVGGFRFTDLPAGRFLLAAAPSRHRPGYLGTARKLGVPAILALDVRQGQALDGVQIELEPAGVISGRVVGQSGDVLRGVRVAALAQLAAGGACRVPMRWATTDDRGEFRLPDLEPGNYCVYALRTPSSAAANRGSATAEGDLPTYHPGAVRAAEARVVTIGAGVERGGVDVLLVSGPVYRIGGLVVRADGRPAARARLSVVRLQDGLFADSFVRSAAGDGTFLFDRLPPGEYVVTAIPGGAATLDNEEAAAATWIGVSTANVENLLIAMTPGATVGGQIVAEDGALPLFAPTGLQMTALPETPGPVPFRARNIAPVGEDWRFEFAHVRGPCLIRAVGGGLPEGWRVTAVRYRGLDVSDEPVEFASDVSSRDLEVVIGTRGARLTGAVLDAERRPAVARTVVLFPADPERRSTTSLRFRLALVDETGRYAFEGLPIGDYLVAAIDGTLDASAFDGRRAFDWLVPRARRVTFNGLEARAVDLQIEQRRDE